MITYRIRSLIGKMDNSKCPPDFLSLLFPGAEPVSVTLTEQDCVVTFESEQTPVDLGPLVKVEAVS